jgi:hypothetical protein
MSERALAVVEEWVSDHVRAAGEAAAGEAPGGEAKELARQCLADASAKGIPQGEIHESIDDLEEFMAGALEEAHERKAHGSEKEDDESEHDENGDEEDEDDEDEDDDDEEEYDDDDEEGDRD